MKHLILSLILFFASGASASLMWKDNTKFRKVSKTEIEKNLEVKKDTQEQSASLDRVRRIRNNRLAKRSNQKQVYGNPPAKAPKSISVVMDQIVKSISESAWGGKGEPKNNM